MRHLLPLVAVLLTGFAPLPFPKPEGRRSDLEKMQGHWLRVGMSIGGKSHDAAASRVIATVTGDRIAFGSPNDIWRLKLDAAGGAKRIDFRRVEPLGGTDVFLGLYRLEGDMLTVCSRTGGEEKDRPVSFDPAQPDVWLHVYKRQKP